MLNYDMQYIKYSKNTASFAKYNRRQKNMTPQEAKLWNIYLKRSKIRFFRQFRIGSYILDFYCPQKHLCVEIDGSQHYEDNAVEYDEERTNFLNGYNIKVIRFTNHEIDTNIHSVISYIYNAMGLDEEDVD